MDLAESGLIRKVLIKDRGAVIFSKFRQSSDLKNIFRMK